MIKVEASIGKDTYKTTLTSSADNTLIADEPFDNGGKNLGFSPKELLSASLAACTSITLRMYADHKKIDLKEIKVDVELLLDATSSTTTIQRKIELIGDLTEEQRTRMLALANVCPVHKILSHPIEIKTEIL